MKLVCVPFVALMSVCLAIASNYADALQPGRVELYCHRTANEEVPENTLESLEQAALDGCDLIEIDLRRTLDGKIVLDHDGFLERLTDGMGEVDDSYYGELQLLDAGGWMGERFQGMRIPLFADALRLARQYDVRLYLDIKTKGLGPEILRILEREGMVQRVQFGGEWEDVRKLYPAADAREATTWVEPGVSAERVRALHAAGKAVVANFSANGQEMDLDSMRAAVAAGVDAVNVDYPRLGADAVGRPVERTLSVLAGQARSGESDARVRAILALARYRGFPLQPEFAHWLLDEDEHVSRAAALALANARPQTPASAFAQALQSEHADARANAAWALGVLGAPASVVEPLLRDPHPEVVQEALLAISRMPGNVDAGLLLPLLSRGEAGDRGSSAVRAAAALALARHQPEIARKEVPEQLRREVHETHMLYADYVRRGKPQLTPSEIDRVVGDFRCQMKMVQAISMLKGDGVIESLEELAFGPIEGFSLENGMLAAFELWDRVGLDPRTAVKALASSDSQIADRAEWILVQGGPSVLAEVRVALQNDNPTVRTRAIRIIAWQGDNASLPALKAMLASNSADPQLVQWAIDKITNLHPDL
jgi:glycerophosphoryl diester phosphodiesterase/HEAT repeat protein